MLNLDLKARLKNKTWWISIVSTLILIGKYFGIDITDYIGKDWQTLVGLIFGLLVIVGVTTDTSTSGISDKVVATATENAVQATNKQETVQAEASTVEINNIVSANSASAKITVDNPDNLQVIGNEVNATSAVVPN